MLHELIVALYGCPGSVFVDSPTGIKVAKGVSYLHPSEVIILDKLCILGTHYKKINDFVHLHSYGSSSESEKHFGLYFRVFCNSLNHVLGPYRKTLIEVEKEVLRDPYISLTRIQYELDKYYALFPVLDELLKEIEEKEVRNYISSHGLSDVIHGCRILELVHKYSISGIPMVKAAMNKILEMCHGQLYKQLSAFMFHGLLLDPYNEFFVEEKDEAKRRQDDIKVHEHYMGPYDLRPNMLPSYIPCRVAQHIGFIGAASTLFSKKEKTDSYLELISHDKEEEFANNLFSVLTKEEFSVFQFSMVVEEIRDYSAEHLWKIVVEDANLLGQLQMFKDFYFLGRGELFLAFFDQARVLANLPLTSATENDLNRAFQFAARSVMYTDDNDAEKFRITVDSAAFVGENASKLKRVQHLLNFIGLSNEVSWPLHTIFTADMLKKYSKIFRFLLSVRHVQQELHNCWMRHMRGRRLRTDYCNPWHMMFIINNLQYYLQIDVLESEFSKLITKIKAEKDFGKIHCAHGEFLSQVMALSFLNWKPVHECLKSIMSTCLEFCHLVSFMSENIDQEDQDELDRYLKDFRQQTLTLLRILAVARDQHQYQSLGQLFLKIDYNKYFSFSASLGRNYKYTKTTNV